MMQINDFDRFFADKGILTSYNGLGATEECFQYYVDATVKKLYESDQFRSHYIKQECYKEFYPDLTSRTKKTGFEFFSDLEKQTKDSIIIPNSTDVFADRFHYSYDEYNIANPNDFKKAIKQYYSRFSGDIILYLSGGVDSELLARILLEYNIEFTPVSFEWLDNDNTMQNADEAKNAYDFCRKNYLSLIREQVKLSDLWKSNEFRNLVQKTRFSSIQVNTHAYMVSTVEAMFPKKLHVFGGEVRYTLQKDQQNVFMYASKTCVNSIYSETLGTGTPQPDTGVTFVEGGIGYDRDFPTLWREVQLYLSGGNSLTRQINSYYNDIENRDGEADGMSFWYDEYYKITQENGVQFDPNNLDSRSLGNLFLRMQNTSRESFDDSGDKCALRSRGWDI